MLDKAQEELREFQQRTDGKMPKVLWSKYYNYDKRKFVEALRKKEDCQKSIQIIEKDVDRMDQKMNEQNQKLEENSSKIASFEDEINQISNVLNEYDQKRKEKQEEIKSLDDRIGRIKID